jgi:hypothetical protein
MASDRGDAGGDTGFEVVREHMAADITGGRDGLLFPAADGVSHMAPSTLYKVFYRSRVSAGRPDLRLS